MLFLLVIVAVPSYIFFQYQKGLKQAGLSEVFSEDIEEFNGQKDDQGRINVLLLGIDARGEEQARTDTIMIAQYDPEKETARTVSLMRDIYVDIPGNGSWKLNTAYFLGGAELLRQTIKENFDIEVQYYALIDFKGFQEVVDVLAPEGIEMNVEKRMSEKIEVVLEPGTQKLNGEELLGYARFRQDAEGDFGRVRRQQEVINALKEELISIKGVAKLPQLVGSITPFIETNISSMERVSLAKDFILNPVDEIESITIPIEGSYSNERYEDAGLVLDIEYEENIAAIKAFLNGEDPNKIVADTEKDDESMNQ